MVWVCSSSSRFADERLTTPSHPLPKKTPPTTTTTTTISWLFLYNHFAFTRFHITSLHLTYFLSTLHFTSLHPTSLDFTYSSLSLHFPYYYIIFFSLLNFILYVTLFYSTPLHLSQLTSKAQTVVPLLMIILSNCSCHQVDNCTAAGERLLCDYKKWDWWVAHTSLHFSLHLVFSIENLTLVYAVKLPALNKTVITT